MAVRAGSVNIADSATSLPPFFPDPSTQLGPVIGNEVARVQIAAIQEGRAGVSALDAVPI